MDSVGVFGEVVGWLMTGRVVLRVRRREGLLGHCNAGGGLPARHEGAVSGPVDDMVQEDRLRTAIGRHHSGEPQCRRLARSRVHGTYTLLAGRIGSPCGQ